MLVGNLGQIAPVKHFKVKVVAEDPTSGRLLPISGIRVIALRSLSSGTGRSTAQTDIDGDAFIQMPLPFYISRVIIGAGTARASGPGFITKLQYVDVTGDDVQPVQIVLTRATEQERVDASTITVAVRTGEDPVAGAKVTFRSELIPKIKDLVTDSNGFVSAPFNVPQAKISVEKEGFKPMRDIVVAPGTSVAIELIPVGKSEEGGFIRLPTPVIDIVSAKSSTPLIVLSLLAIAVGAAFLLLRK